MLCRCCVHQNTCLAMQEHSSTAEGQSGAPLGHHLSSTIGQLESTLGQHHEDASYSQSSRSSCLELLLHRQLSCLVALNGLSP